MTNRSPAKRPCTLLSSSLTRCGKHECYEFRVWGQWSWRWLLLLAFCNVLISVWNNSSGFWGILTHTQSYISIILPRATLPWVDYYTDAPKYYTTKAMEYCTTTYHGEKRRKISRVVISDTATATAMPRLMPECCTEGTNFYTTKAPEYYTETYAAPAYYTEAPQYYTTKALEYYTTTYHVNNGVVLLLGVVSSMAGSTTGVPMSPGYGGYQSTILPCSLTIKHKLPLLQLTTLRIPSAPPSRLQIITPQLMLPQTTTLNLHYQMVEYYVEAPKFYITKAPEYKNGRILHRSNHGTLWRCAIVNVATVTVGSTTGVPISPGYGGREHIATTGYYTEALQVLHHKGSKTLHHDLCCPDVTTQKLRSIFIPRASLPSPRRLLNNNVNTFLLYEGLQYYATKAPEY
ncbi:hypothetical protein DAPPUDRAFT_234437 [Daphnia pulex]|uniref:Uncharacterized protein n=1 Tax=Daphnia pulex TaxID=6669 RepID=E9FWL7_DAPPU|nr:hypothetical protein DAPPUDRAFT_234437 [Daphnia pulex]|eukprot:EFX88412.1 hypothetical protein DAPPUDRAFT_234437 [Daphnia pulex]